jgi:predicted ArsR family transcriptional regulator
MSRRSYTQELGSLAALLEPTRERLYRHVAAQDRPVTRDDAAVAAGISRAMAAFHLDRLVEAGLLRAKYQRLSGRTGRGAGRPSKLYARSRRRFAVTEPRTDHELLGRLLAKAVEKRAAVDEARTDGNRYGRLLGAQARRRLGGRRSDERLAGCVNDVLADVGFGPRRIGNETRVSSCPFDPLSREFPTVVCQAALAIVRGVIDGVGVPNLGVQRREPVGSSCCVVIQNHAAPTAS